MIKFGIALCIFTAIPLDALACRDFYPTHKARMDVAKIALVARVSGVLVPALEREDYDDNRDWTSFVYSPRTVRLVVTSTLKGETPKRLELVIEQCNGSLNATIGSAVHAYKIHGKWRLDPTSDAP